jgi:IS30 family transposase
MKNSEKGQQQMDDSSCKHEKLKSRVIETESKNKELEKEIEEILKNKNSLEEMIKTNSYKQNHADDRDK